MHHVSFYHIQQALLYDETQRSTASGGEPGQGELSATDGNAPGEQGGADTTASRPSGREAEGFSRDDGGVIGERPATYLTQNKIKSEKCFTYNNETANLKINLELISMLLSTSEDDYRRWG